MMTRRTLLTCLTASPLLNAAAWERRPYPEWDASLRDKLLTDSPWARQVSVRYEFVLAVGDAPAHTEAELTIRWASALPIRRAMAQEWPAEGDKPEPAEYIITVSGFPQNTTPRGARWLEAQILDSAYLTVKGQRSRKATAAYVPPHGTHLTAELRFPKDPLLHEDDGTVEFTAQAGNFRIAQKFALRKMIYEGQLAL
ncbi:MAG: hypothetical protein JNK87_01920 [Bryobacterales bacterium]|nr:hypothetical protein [Bryobacterales bacterium]